MSASTMLRAFSRVMKTKRRGCAIAFLKAAVAYYASLGITIERVMTDNDSCYKVFAFRRACKRLGLRHIRTRPYTPKTNGKAERFIRTALREWAYAKAYDTSRQRAAGFRGPARTKAGNGHRASPDDGLGGNSTVMQGTYFMHSGPTMERRAFRG